MPCRGFARVTRTGIVKCSLRQRRLPSEEMANFGIGKCCVHLRLASNYMGNCWHRRTSAGFSGDYSSHPGELAPARVTKVTRSGGGWALTAKHFHDNREDLTEFQNAEIQRRDYRPGNRHRTVRHRVDRGSWKQNRIATALNAVSSYRKTEVISSVVRSGHKLLRYIESFVHEI